MRYIISDIHGCYDEYMALLEKIGFSDTDELYILGDAMDRGPEPIKVIKDIMGRSNVRYIIGNHDFIMLMIMKKLMVEITEENYAAHLSEDDLRDYFFWLRDGGEVTARQFAKLPTDEKFAILEFLKDSSVYEVLEDKGRRFVLVHAGIDRFRDDKPLEEYECYDFFFKRADYKRRCFQDGSTYLVTGHTPTFHINPDKSSDVYRANGHIAIDCGCVFGGKLAAYCVETGEVFYVSGLK